MTDTAISTKYKGRFAPSPTGPLHLGSLIAATGSYLQARQHKGTWRVRIDDIDPEREVPGASDDILRTLECYGFEWDGPVIYQRQQLERHQTSLSSLAQTDRLYACTCSRKLINEQANALGQAGVYPGTCRHQTQPVEQPHALRVNTLGAEIIFQDSIQGQQRYSLETCGGDFVVRRADGFIAYQLATAIDDCAEGYTEIVRGADLLDSTPRQIFIQNLLGLHSPAYCHLPVLVDAEGNKYSKQTYAEPLSRKTPSRYLWTVMHFLGQEPPLELRNTSLTELWGWAVQSWKIKAVPVKKNLSLADI